MSIQNPTLLIVDDTPLNIELLDGVLGQDYEILFATRGEDALEIAREEAPDLILMDVMMPEMDGYEVCSRLKADPRTAGIPIIFVTALDQEADEARGLELGAIDYITKPINPVIVKARVRNHIELKRHQDILRGLTFLDGLTCIANRRRFDQFLDLEWRRAVRNGSRLSLIMIDIDLFKPFNDTHGHAAGDECLKQVAHGMAREIQRPGDLVARYGGEEFVCVLPETDPQGALAVAERIQARLAALALPHGASKVAPVVTLSMGVATVQPVEGEDPASVIEAADRALYEAKRLGRNRIEGV